jgi:AraC-like DNA-binding protein
MESEMCLHPFQYHRGEMHCLPHTHDEYNIVFGLEQGLECSLRGRVETLAPGDVLVINPGEVHHGRYGGREAHSRGLTIHIPESVLKKVLRKMRFPGDLDRSRVLFLDKVNDPTLPPLLQELMHEIDQRQSGYEMIVDSIMLQILIHLFRHMLTPSLEKAVLVLPRQLPSWQMIRALEYMNSRGESKFSLAELCAQIGTSTSRFMQLFRNSVGSVSPHVYYHRLIVEKAQRLLVASDLSVSDLSVKEIAYELGFQNESHFCRVFRSCTGTTPGTFRDQARRML